MHHLTVLGACLRRGMWRAGRGSLISTKSVCVTRTFRTAPPSLFAAARLALRSHNDETRKISQQPLTNPRPVPRAVKDQLLRFDSKTAAVFEDICTVPNLLTIGRIAMCPFIGYAVATHQPYLSITLLTIAGASDLLDGWIARKFKSFTVFGSIADPAADKILMATMVIALGTAGQLPLPLMGIILGRDVFLVARAFYVRYRSLPPPRTWARYWDMTLPSVQVIPSWVSKINTLLQLLLVGVLTIYPVIPDEYKEHPHTAYALRGLMGIVAATTIWSGVDYAVSRRAVRYLHSK